jgi:hypothetical protein
MSQTASEQAARLQAEKLDASLAAIQRSLLSTARPARSRPRSRRIGRTHHVTPIADIKECEDHAMLGVFSELVQRTTNPYTIPTQLNRLVDLAVTVRYRCGKAQYEAVAVPDPEFEAANFGTRLRMVKYLQDLRLLLWLLCRKEYTCHRSLVVNSSPRSELVLEARLVSSWTIWTTFEIASLAPQGKIRCRDEAYLEYLLRVLRSEPLKLKINHQILNSVHPLTGILLWQIDLNADLGQALKLRLARQQANLKKLVHKVSITKAGVLENSLRRLGIHLDALLEDSTRWYVGQMETIFEQLKRTGYSPLPLNGHLFNISRHIS